MKGKGLGTLLILLLLLAVPSLVQADAAGAPALTLDEGKALANQFFHEVLAQGNMETAGQILAPSFRQLDRSLGGKTLGHYDFRLAAAFQRNGFTALDYNVDALAVDGATVAVCWTAKGKLADHFILLQPEHVTTEYAMDVYWGTFEMYAKPERIASWTGMSFLEVADGQIVQAMTNMESVDVRMDPAYVQEMRDSDAAILLR